MSTIRVARRRRFTSVDRTTVNDARLSFRALGLLTWLLDKPDDWRFDSSEIGGADRDGREGRDAIRAAMKELRELGYARYQKVQGPGGRWSTEVTIYETPDVDEPECDRPLGECALADDDPSPTTENPSPVEPVTDDWNPVAGPTPGKPTVGFSGAITKRFATETDDDSATHVNERTNDPPPNGSSSSHRSPTDQLIALCAEALYQHAPNLVHRPRPWKARTRREFARERADELRDLIDRDVPLLGAAQALTELPPATIVAAARQLGIPVSAADAVFEQPAPVISLEVRQAVSHVAGLCLTGAFDEARAWISDGCPEQAREAAWAELERRTGTRTTA